jgi:GNAT superfamily N-acetyltransferase
LALIPDEREDDRSAALLEQQELTLWVPDPLDTGLAVHHVNPYSELGDKAEQFVYANYRERGYCAVSSRSWIEEIQPWRDGSTLHVITEGTEVLGVIRTVVGEFHELPVGQFDLVADLEPGTQLLDGGSLAVKFDYRGFGLATELYRQWIQFGIRHRVDGFAMMMDDGMVEIMRKYYALPTHTLAERRQYMGGDIEPLVVWMDEMLEALARQRPALYRYAIEGFTPEEIVEFDLPILLD